MNGLAGHGVWSDRLIRWAASYLPVIIAVLVGLAWFWPGTLEDRAERQRFVIYALAAALIALGIAQIIGHIWFRERPYVHHSAHLLLAPSADPSFPSDHAIGGFALAMPFVYARHKLGLGLTVLAPLLCLTRVAAGTHNPIDIVGAPSWARRLPGRSGYFVTGLSSEFAAELMDH